jgi:hypothetical protein
MIPETWKGKTLTHQWTYRDADGAPWALLPDTIGVDQRRSFPSSSTTGRRGMRAGPPHQDPCMGCISWPRIPTSLCLSLRARNAPRPCAISDLWQSRA